MEEVKRWVNFVKMFTIPDNSEWKINNYPLIIISLTSNIQLVNKKL